MTKEELKKSIILIFANKQDKENCLKTSDIIKLYDLTSIKSHIWHIQECSTKTNTNLYEGMQWLSNELVKDSETFKNNPYLSKINSK